VQQGRLVDIAAVPLSCFCLVQRDTYLGASAFVLYTCARGCHVPCRVPCHEQACDDGVATAAKSCAERVHLCLQVLPEEVDLPAEGKGGQGGGEG
jgi:hypothetical protein